MAKTKEFFNPSGYDMPSPTRFLILDDLPHTSSVITAYLQQLRSLVDAPYAAMLTTTSRLANRLRSKFLHEIETKQLDQTALAVAIGSAGETLFKSLDLDIPHITLHPQRVLQGSSTLILSKTGVSLDQEARCALDSLPSELLEGSPGVVLIDDTVFSGSTIEAVVKTLSTVMPTARFLVLTATYTPRFAREYLPADLKIIAGLTLTTHTAYSEGVNSVDARDFVSDDALPFADGNSISFAEEENWMRAWFGKNYGEARNICQKIREVTRSIP